MKWLINPPGWLEPAIACVIGMIGVAFFISAAVGDSQQPRQEYSVTLYSGGRAVEHWYVHSFETDGQTTKIEGGIIVVGGPIVVQPYKGNGRPR